MVIEPVADLPLLIPFFKIQADFKHFGSHPNRLRVSKFTKVVASLSSVTGFAQDEQGAHGVRIVTYRASRISPSTFPRGLEFP